MVEQIRNEKYFLSCLNTEQQEDTEQPKENSIFLAETILERKGYWQTDQWIYRIVVGAMSLTLIFSLGGAILLETNNKKIPDVLIALGTGALGGIAGLLVPTPSRYSNHD